MPIIKKMKHMRALSQKSKLVRSRLRRTHEHGQSMANPEPSPEPTPEPTPEPQQPPVVLDSEAILAQLKEIPFVGENAHVLG